MRANLKLPAAARISTRNHDHVQNQPSAQMYSIRSQYHLNHKSPAVSPLFSVNASGTGVSVSIDLPTDYSIISSTMEVVVIADVNLD